jgi:hypothetical protein
MCTGCGFGCAQISSPVVLVPKAFIGDTCGAQLHIKTGRAGVDAPELPALTPEQARAPMNHAPHAGRCQQVSP